MYPRRGFSLSILPLNSNLKNVFRNLVQRQFFTKYGFNFREKLSGIKSIEDINNKIREIVRKGQVYKLFLEESPSNRSGRNNVIKVWLHHCECVAAQRLRRCQQMFTLYSKWWEEKAFKEYMKRMRQNLTRRTRDFAFGSVGISAYNWEKYRITDEEIKKNEQEFDYINVLKENTICLACDPSQKDVDDMKVCACGTMKTPKTYEDWALFIVKPDLVIWRRLHPSGSGQYEYKMFGTYNDVSAEDFLNVQIDIDYRRSWDTSAVVLEHGETDESSNSDIIYWELLWPRLFVNRDYVFNRRYLIDEESKYIFILNKSTEYPKFPKYPDKYRIDDYWSCMVIRPHDGDMKKPGIEFTLTYYDNPGVSIPSSVTTWVAMRAMPDFLDKLREATKHYKEFCLREGTSKACKEIIEAERAAEAQRQKDKLDYCSLLRNSNRTLTQDTVKDKRSGNNKDISSSDVCGVHTNNHGNRFKYLQPLYYFFQ
ncbi:stAR-related lipid transfer protein 7, mitochondrial isoform X1 [Diorhabda sublineata]|uniref:stAR-related lipid transfer protein 7, mitochondrial isoform X1 n=1 Tax=Diorhabda sublineata TaxID=1163346 RepID=UPI0024E118EA|nr:stAR-related lipid transfer protein 7, mitochondrial isoform X1 [Diorhabda sublineata]